VSQTYVYNNGTQWATGIYEASNPRLEKDHVSVKWSTRACVNVSHVSLSRTQMARSMNDSSQHHKLIDFVPKKLTKQKRIGTVRVLRISRTFSVQRPTQSLSTNYQHPSFINNTARLYQLDHSQQSFRHSKSGIVRARSMDEAR
jgi:hypothetical protein